MSVVLNPGPWPSPAPRVRNLGQSATLAINARSRELLAEGREVFRMGLGQSPFPVPQVMQQALHAHVHEKDYLPVEGLRTLRESFCGYLRRTEGLDYDPANVLIGPGTKELMFLVQMVYRGDIVIPSPSWVSYAPQARIIGRKVEWLPTSLEQGLRVTPEALEAVCAKDPMKPRLLIINYPGNPTGASYSAEQLQAIAEVARRHRMVVLSDEIYSGLHFDGAHQSIARWYPEGTIISNGLSKWAGAGGWRLGAFAFPESLAWLHRTMAAVASETYTTVSAPIQYAAIAGFDASAEMDDYLARARRVLKPLAWHAYYRLVAAGARVVEPEGGFYLMANFDSQRDALARRGIRNGTAFCEALLEQTGVAALPGVQFGRPASELSLRVALVDFDGEAAQAAADGDAVIDETFLRARCGHVMEAVDRIADWVGAAGVRAGVQAGGRRAQSM